MEVENLTALITGGASGLGAACARLLAQHGVNVVIFDQNMEAAEGLASDIDALAIQCDVASSESVDNAFALLTKNSSTPRVCINCAGIAPAKRVVGKDGPMPMEDFARTININLNGTFNIIRKAAHLMSQLDPINEHGERGVIINTASVAAYEGQIGQAAYSASKAGVVGMTLPIARELARFGIRVNTIAPGLFETPMLLNMPEQVQNNLIDSMPFPKRFGKPNEYASLVQHIISNPMLNGTVIRLDGAMRMS